MTKKTTFQLTKKKIILVAFFLIILVILSFLVVRFFLKVDFTLLRQTFSKKFQIDQLGWLFLCFVVLVYIIIWESLYLYTYIRQFKIKIAWYRWLLFGLITILLNGITPFYLGSEPYKFYWLKKNGLKNRDCLVIISITTFFWNLLDIIITIPSFAYLSSFYKQMIQNSDFINVYWLAFAGLIINLTILAVLLALNYSVNFHVFCNLIRNKILKWLHKPYKSKNEIIDDYKTKALYQKHFVAHLCNKKNFFIQTMGTLVYLVVIYCGVYFALRFFQIQEWDFWLTFNLVNVATTANNYFPTPGGEVGVQIILQKFLLAFQTNNNNTPVANFKNNLNVSIFLWRSFVFYFPVFLGISSLPVYLWPKIKQLWIKK